MEMVSNEPTLPDYLWAIAKAETECSFHSEADGFEFRCIRGKVSVSGQFHYPCAVCKGTGRVPRFPELREPCKHVRGGTVWGNKKYPRCADCKATGYVPLWSKPEDLATWQATLGRALIGLLDSSDYEIALWEGDLFGAFKAATEVLGIEVGQKETP